MSEARAALAALHATWPAAETRTQGPWTLRRGAGGGNRVSAATLEGPFSEADIDRAEAGMRDLGQDPLFMVREGDDGLDAALAARGYLRRDATVLMAAALADLALAPPPRLAAIPAWPPIAIQAELWAAGGIGPARIAVMERCPQPATTFLARARDKPAGCVFAACHGGTIMAHALFVAPSFRGSGVARHLMAGVGLWGRAYGAETLAVAVTEENAAARGLYASLGLGDVGHYHYRAFPPHGTA